MNASPARRRWFQLHLSTVIALTMACVVLMFLNLVPRHQIAYTSNVENFFSDLYGWPMPLYEKSGTQWYGKEGQNLPLITLDYKQISMAVILDSITSLVCLYTVWRGAEWIARRRKQVRRE